MSGVQHLTLADDAEGQRLDRWLKRTFPQLTQGRVEKMCRKGELRLDGGRVKASTRLSEGQVLRVPPIAAAAPTRAPAAPRVSDADAEMIRSCVIYRDDDLIALNKPAGLAVQGGTGTHRHVDMLSEALMFDRDEKPKLVHRLDRDTSGVLVLARHGRAAAAISKAFQYKSTRKIYWAVVPGVPSPKIGTIRYGLVKAPGHGPHGAGEKMICLHPDKVDGTEGAKRAISDYFVLEAAAKRAAWVALVPVTGRTHQLRAHMAEIGHPIIGDGKYGANSSVNEGDGWGALLGGEISRKLHLHARHLTFDHPTNGSRVSLTAELPDHMARTWEVFGWDPRDYPGDPFEELE